MPSISSIFDLSKIGNYPKGYDPAQHGQYDPSRYYGKPDTAFGDLKVQEIPQWIQRREKGFRPFAALISRAFWRWQLKYIHPRKAGPAGYLQLIIATSMFFYVINYQRIRGHRSYNYH